MRLVYSGASKPSAIAITAADPDIIARRSSFGEVNWGRREAATVLNPDITMAVNKHMMRIAFKENGVPSPELFTAEEVERILDDAAYGTPATRFIGRPDYHHCGRGLWRIYDHASLQRALRGTPKKAAATHFMEFVDAPHEYRVHVFKGRSIRISEKIFGTTGTTNHGDYTTAKPTDRVWHVRKAAKAAVDALGLDFGAVDILADSERCWVLEVNAAPGLGGTLPQLYAETFQRYFRGDWDD